MIQCDTLRTRDVSDRPVRAGNKNGTVLEMEKFKNQYYCSKRFGWCFTSKSKVYQQYTTDSNLTGPFRTLYSGELKIRKTKME